MEIKTIQDCCPSCGGDRLVHGAVEDHGANTSEIAVECWECGWTGGQWYKDGYFVGHTSEAGVVCGYYLT